MLKDIIKYERKQRGLTQHQLADKLSIPRSTLSNIELGLNSMSIELLIKFADFFEVSTDYLLGRTIYKKWGEYYVRNNYKNYINCV